MEEKYRHGDVLLVRIGRIPENAVGVENVLAYGESTGHKHVVSGKAVQVMEYEGKKFVQVEETATLTHEEHGVIALPKGSYAVVRQVEYTPQGLRQVQD